MAATTTSSMFFTLFSLEVNNTHTNSKTMSYSTEMIIQKHSLNKQNLKNTEAKSRFLQQCNNNKYTTHNYCVQNPNE